jgi:hypothetical protein
VKPGSFFSGPTYYLKVKALEDSTKNATEALEYFYSCIDSGYQEKSRDPWETFVAFVIIAVAFVLAAPSGGTSLTLAAAATAFLTAVLYISIATAVLAKAGYGGVAMSLGQFLQAVEPLVQIASIVLLFTGIQAAYKATQTAATEAAKDATTDAAVDVAMDAAKKSAVEVVMEMAKEMFNNLFIQPFSNPSLAHSTRIAGYIFNLYTERENRDMEKELKMYRSKLAELKEQEEMSKVNHGLIEMSQVKYDPLQVDYSFYASIYDKPYEWWATAFHTGNIQRTEVNALWLSDPKSAII